MHASHWYSRSRAPTSGSTAGTSPTPQQPRRRRRRQCGIRPASSPDGPRPARTAAPATPPICTFHIGNSLTETVNEWLVPVAASARHDLESHRFTIRGASTDWLWDHPRTGCARCDARLAELREESARAAADHELVCPQRQRVHPATVLAAHPVASLRQEIGLRIRQIVMNSLPFSAATTCRPGS